MPKLCRSVPKYRKHRASRQAIVTLNGRDFYLGPHGSRVSRREYDRLIAEWLSGGRTLAVQGDHAITIVELIAAYWRHVRDYCVKNGKPTGEQATVKVALRYVKNLYMRQPANEFGPLALKAVRQTMIDAGLARTTINGNVLRIRRMFRWAVAEELIEPSQYEGLRAIQGIRKGSGVREATPIKSVDQKSIVAVQKHLPETVSDMVQLQYLTGMRPGEVCCLRPMDIDQTSDVWTYVPSIHKNEHHEQERKVYIGPLAQLVLGKYMIRDSSEYCFRPCDSEAKRRAMKHAQRRTPLSCGDRPGTNRKKKPNRKAGDKYSVDSYRRAIQRACDLASIPHWSPNQLRHSTATIVREKFGLEAAQVILGHTGAAVTQIYAERDNAKGLEVAREIG